MSLEDRITDQKRKRFNELIRMGRMVRETLATDGWLKVGFPLLQKSIRSTIGSYKDGEWVPGTMLDMGSNSDYQKGYAQALMDFQNRLFAYVKNIKLSQDTLKAMDAEETVEYKIPMIDEGGGY